MYAQPNETAAVVSKYQNGERVRPEQGYPMRLVLPGYEGNMNIKWVTSLQVVSAPAHTKDESGEYTDILADGRLDYDEELLGRFDYVIASIHSRFKMDGAAITERVLHAMDDPHMTILAHPTGRLLLSREPYALDVEAVLQKAAAVGVAVELNCDPHRMDLDWRYLKRARELGVTIEIGPDAHSARSLEWTDLGVSVARKGWLRRDDILNARETHDVLAFARRRR